MSLKLPIIGMCGTGVPGFLYARHRGIVYTATIVFIQGQFTPSLILDPRTPMGNSVIFQTASPGFNLRIVSSTGVSYNLGYRNSVLNINEDPSVVIPITTQYNDNFPSGLRLSILASAPYTFFYNNQPIAILAYISNGRGGIEVDGQGNPLYQEIEGDFFYFPLNWYPLGNCGTGINDLSFINQTCLNWLKSGTLPQVQYFTVQDQCNIGNVFQYCGFSNTCTSNCFGPCANPQSSCTYDKGNNAYYCPNETPTCNNTGFIVAIVLLVLLIIVLVVLLFVLK